MALAVISALHFTLADRLFISWFEKGRAVYVPDGPEKTDSHLKCVSLAELTSQHNQILI